jgi:hypothetical protein
MNKETIKRDEFGGISFKQKRPWVGLDPRVVMAPDADLLAALNLVGQAPEGEGKVDPSLRRRLER